MRLDEIQDIEFIKNELKRFMIQCKANYTKDNNIFKANGYYYN